jgi:long-chain fatty acid transport protein
MGGTGISNFNGAESAFANPALITKSKKTTEVTIGATILMPSVSFKSTANVFGAGTIDESSTAGDGMIPAVAAINKVNDSLAWGLALYGVGGMGVDYRDTTGTMIDNVNDNLMLMRMSIPLAYTISGFSGAIAPVIEYGSLSMSTRAGSPSAGATTDIALGFEIAAAYEISGVSLGLDYKSAVTHDFKNTFLSSDSTGNKQSKLDTPAVLALGVSYKMAEHTIALDYKNITFSSAKGLEDFQWEDQTVIALGYEYAVKTWALRVGYNYGASPLPELKSDASNLAQVAGSYMAFPAVTESHYTLGGSYSFNEQMSIDLAYMFATGSATTDVTVGQIGLNAAGSFTATNDQSALSVALNYGF